jgi:outer membrane biosynthesis protein TonB
LFPDCVLCHFFFFFFFFLPFLPCSSAEARSVGEARRSREEMSQVACGECGKMNAASAKFCRGCGAKPQSAESAGAAPACFACGKVNAPGYKACKDCGAPPPKPKKDPPPKAEESSKETSKESSKESEPAKPAKKAPDSAKPVPAKKEPEQPPEPKKPAAAKQVACQNCGFKQDSNYDKCAKCKEENPAKAAEAKKAAEKKPAPAPAAAKPKVEENPKDELLKGVEFKTKAKGATESSSIKLGDLAAGMRVWVTVAGEDGWAPAEVLAVKGNVVRVKHEDDGAENEYPPAKVFIRNPPNLDNVSDLTQLSYMHEPGLLYILSERYNNSNIYTFTGTTLIAVNPYQRLPLYSKEVLDSYVGQPIGRLPPHVFAVRNNHRIRASF